VRFTSVVFSQEAKILVIGLSSTKIGVSWKSYFLSCTAAWTGACCGLQGIPDVLIYCPLAVKVGESCELIAVVSLFSPQNFVVGEVVLFAPDKFDLTNAGQCFHQD
jgi:hypothetical protein